MPTSANRGLAIPLQVAKKKDARKGAKWRPHLIHRIRASMAGNAHPRFVYILNKQMPKPSRLERDRLHGFSQVPHCKVEQAVTVQAGPPGNGKAVCRRVAACRRARACHETHTQPTVSTNLPCASTTFPKMLWPLPSVPEREMERKRERGDGEVRWQGRVRRWEGRARGAGKRVSERQRANEGCKQRGL